MNILDAIDDVILWHGSGDAYNSAPADDIDPDDIYDSDLCNCGHFHSGDCPDPGAPCGSYRCCIN